MWYEGHRDKLDESSMQQLVQQTGNAIDVAAPDSWLWLGHRVITGDGCTVTMVDTPDDQRAYPQPESQKPGCGWPMMRCVVLFALSTGVVLEAAMGKQKGKLTSEVSLFREIDEIIEENDIFLADRFYSGWFDLARLMKRGAHVAVRKHQRRKTDFRTGVEYTKDDLAVLFRRRWQAELNLRSLKTAMQMDHLRCKKPH